MDQKHKTDEIDGRYKTDLQFTSTIQIKRMRGIYLLLKHEQVVYVGQSENILQRIGVHLANSNKEFDGYSYAIVSTGNLDEIEADLIVKHKTSLNMGLPPNKKYATPAFMKKHLGVSGWKIRKIIQAGALPVWKDYYLISEFLEV